MSPANLSVKVGWVLVFPAFQRTAAAWAGITARAVDRAHSEQGAGGDGEAHGVQGGGRAALDVGAIRCKEGNGIALRDGDSESTRQGRLSVMLSLCADGWESTSGGQGECATLD
jgi:hypothetical protein